MKPTMGVPSLTAGQYLAPRLFLEGKMCQLNMVDMSARAFSDQRTDLTSSQWHTDFTDLTSMGQISHQYDIEYQIEGSGDGSS